MSFFAGLCRFLLAFFLLVVPAFMQAAKAEECNPASKAKVIEFYAPWCEPCKRLDATLVPIRAEYDGQVEFVSYNVDDPAVREIADKYGVCPIPTLVFIDKNDSVRGYAIGCSQEAVIEKGINKILPAAARQLSREKGSADRT